MAGEPRCTKEAETPAAQIQALLGRIRRGAGMQIGLQLKEGVSRPDLTPLRTDPQPPRFSRQFADDYMTPRVRRVRRRCDSKKVTVLRVSSMGRWRVVAVEEGEAAVEGETESTMDDGAFVAL
uniref:Uncharacterized protein n=1 Tax=Oryza sativa subsp. japonica TaxID=39947 RepID=Q6ZBC2_ORYSJ|nr:hypothetical protein [Oryza sativa Japonica Group]